MKMRGESRFSVQSGQTILLFIYSYFHVSAGDALLMQNMVETEIFNFKKVRLRSLGSTFTPLLSYTRYLIALTASLLSRLGKGSISTSSSMEAQSCACCSFFGLSVYSFTRRRLCGDFSISPSPLQGQCLLFILVLGISWFVAPYASNCFTDWHYFFLIFHGIMFKLPCSQFYPLIWSVLLLELIMQYGLLQQVMISENHVKDRC